MARNDKVKNFLLNFFTYIVLKEFSSGVYTPKKIAIKYGRSRQSVYYYVKKLHELGYIRKKFRSSNGTVYELTPEGKKLLLELDEHHNASKVKKFSGGMRLRVRLHGLRFVFPVLERGVFGFDRSWVLRNWEKRYADFGSVSVEEVPGKIILYVKRVYDDNVYRGLFRAFRAALVFGQYFQRVTGYKLGFPEFDDRQLQIAIENDPLGRALFQAFGRFKYKVGDRGIGPDGSPGNGIIELEFLGSESHIDAQKYLDLPDNVKLMEENLLRKLSQIETLIQLLIETDTKMIELQTKIAESIAKLSESFEKLLGGLINQESSDRSGERKDSRPRPEGWYM